MSSKTSAYIGLVAAVIGLMTAICGLVTQLGAFGDLRIPGLPGVSRSDDTGDDDDPFGGCNPAALTPQLQLSRGSGPSGTELTVSGTGFCPEVRVDVFFHTETLQFAETGADGAFSVDVRIPGTFDFTAPNQVTIKARGRYVSARTPFELTTQ